MLAGIPGVCGPSIWGDFSKFLWTDLVSIYLLVLPVCRVKTHSDSLPTFHFLITKATADFAMFNSLDMSLKKWTFLEYRPFSKSDSSEFNGMLHATNTKAVPNTILR
ncbi:hypothetical protein TNCV_4196491 [Trichonephila clavipes]|nr:hypothetical protein TNCV_4196491 [Trichonephila clavipes]